MRKYNIILTISGVVAIVGIVVLAYLVGELVGITHYCRVVPATSAPDICWELVK